MIDHGSQNLLMIEPSNPPSADPVDDDLTKIMRVAIDDNGPTYRDLADPTGEKGR